MEIVKSFEDSRYYDRLYQERGMTCEKSAWYWGLGEDGKLYCFCDTFFATTEYREFSDVTGPEGVGNNFPMLSISDMRRIVKEFEHLLVFL